jgi:hypothetical protein
MKITTFQLFDGQHCETTATGSLLKQIGIELSESMLFGLGEGLGYLLWQMKTMDIPFIGGRIKTDAITQNICRNLKLQLEVKETSSIAKAWQNIETPISQQKAVGLKLDCYHLDYFTNKIHFAGHYATMYGYDEQYAYLNDTAQQGGAVRTTLKNLEKARNEKGPMSSRNLSFTISQTEKLPDLKPVLMKAIARNATDFLNPPIKNLGYKGIAKTAAAIRKWFRESTNVTEEFKTAAMLMERAGTGGALFRNLYRDFLKEAYEVTGLLELSPAYHAYKGHATLWTEIAALFQKVSETQDERYLIQASEIFLQLSIEEPQTMKKLRDACG